MNRKQNNNPKILVVDDLPQNIQIIARLLEREGYDVAAASNGLKALELLDKSDFDLILLDVMMPQMDGFEVCHRIKAQEKLKDIPVIFVTAKTDLDEIIHGFEEGAVDYITKPFQSKEMTIRVKTHLDLKRAREELQVKNQALLEATATKDRFFSILAHDLKSPFNGLLGFTQFLLDNFDDLPSSEIRDIIKKLRLASQSGYDLTVQLLDWAKSQMGDLQFHPQPTSLSKLLEELAELVQGAAQMKGIEIKLQLAPLQVLCDPQITSTILRNLVSNAIKFTPQGGWVQLSLHALEKHVEIRVQDTGIGIPAEDIPKLFQLTKPYTRQGTDHEHGTGLGLLLCKEFAEQQGGAIRFQSEEGKGSTFSLILPR